MYRGIDKPMKKFKLTAVAGLMAMVSGPVFAQSSVTLFGMLDEGINYTSNSGGKSAWQMSSIDLATSRFGLKGQEDLGSGIQAIFDLESGFNTESGTLLYGGRLFGYEAYVGLVSDSFGSLTLGRQFDSIVDTVAPLTANGNWGGYLFSHPFDNDNTDGIYHVANSVKYTSPTFRGLSATALIGLSNQAGGFANNRAVSAGIKYNIGDFNLAAAYADLSNPGMTSGGSIAADDANFSAKNQKTYGIGASYAIHGVTLAAVYTHVAIQSPVSSVFIGDLGLEGGHLNFDNAEVNVLYNFTPALIFGGMYTYTRAISSIGGASTSTHWNQLGVQAQYLLSKRTSLYAQAVYQKVSDSAASNVLGYAYIPGSAGVSSTSNQTVVRVAINHTF